MIRQSSRLLTERAGWLAETRRDRSTGSAPRARAGRTRDPGCGDATRGASPLSVRDERQHRLRSLPLGGGWGVRLLLLARQQASSSTPRGVHLTPALAMTGDLDRLTGWMRGSDAS